jgi:hypothetical protein
MIILILFLIIFVPFGIWAAITQDNIDKNKSTNHKVNSTNTTD